MNHTVQVTVEIPKDEYKEIKKFVDGRRDIPSVGFLIYNGYKAHLNMARIAMETQAVQADQEAINEKESIPSKIITLH